MNNKETMPRVLRWQEIAERFHCGRSKALLVLHAMNPSYFGRTPYVTEEELEQHVSKNEIEVAWPKRK